MPTIGFLKIPDLFRICKKFEKSTHGNVIRVEGWIVVSSKGVR